MSYSNDYRGGGGGYSGGGGYGGSNGYSGGGGGGGYSSGLGSISFPSFIELYLLGCDADFCEADMIEALEVGMAVLVAAAAEVLVVVDSAEAEAIA
jgi:hypothetical protein